MIKSVPIICMLLASTIARAGDSLPFMLDTRDVTILSKAELAYNSSWIGGDSSATVVIYDNGSEVYRGSGVGDYEWISAADGRHTLTYTTYIDGVAQDEVYEAIVYSGYKYELVDGKVVLQGMEYQDGVLNIPSEIDGYPVAEIAAEAFAGCSELTSVTIPGSVERIGRNAFEGCIGLKNVTMPFEMLHQLKIEKNNWILGVDDVYQSNDIGDNKSTSMTLEMEGPCDFSFEWKVSSERNYDKLKWYLDGTRKNEISGEGNGWQTVDCSIPEGNHTVTWEYSKDGSVSSGDDCGWVKIGDTGKYSLATLFPDSYASMTNICLLGPGDSIFKNVFADCSEIERIVIPSSVTNIDVSAFQGCTSLKYLEVDDGNPEFTMIDGLLCNKDITRVLFAVPAISTVIIPNIVTNIATNAFLGCVSLRYVELPYSLKSQVEKEDLFASCLDDMEIVYVRTTADPLDGEWHEGSEGVGDGVSLKFTANDSSSVWIETVVTNAGRVSFEWKISSEKFKNYKIDYFSFLIDGQEIVWDNGEVDWTNLVYEITGEGEHVLRWVYTKDESGKSGQDCAWLKDFSFTPLVTVAFSMGDADEGRLPESVTGYSGDTLVIPEDCVLRKAKHTFSGWTDGALNYVPGAVYTLSLTDLTLLPVWVAKIVEAPVIEVAGRYYTQKTTASISCQTEGARIYYTLDGTEPTAESNLYEGPFEVEGSAVIRALACKDDWFSSETAQASTERALWTSGECLNSAHLPFLTDSTAGWVRDMNITHDGQASMRSGTIGDSQESSINLTVNGPGEISFWWKVSSESYKNYQVDYLSFTVDGVERHWICGEVDWAKVSFVIEDDGAHELKWTYKKDAENSEGSDAAWLDEVVWRTEGFSPITYTNLRGATHSNPKMYQEGTLVSFTNPSGVTGYTFAGWIPSQITADMTGAQIVTAKWNWNPQDATVESSITGGKEVPVKAEWVTEELDRRFGLGKKELFIERFGDDFALALLKKTGKRDSAGNELCVWHDYVAGTDPTDADSVFRARIEMVDGKPVVSWDPDLNSDGEERVYLVHGKEHLMDSWHLPVTAIDRFFKVEVSMPFDNIVLFNVNGGSSIGAISIRIGQPLGILPEPTREGYTFLGWFTGLEDGGVVTPETIVTDDMTIYAHWTVNSYTVTFDANGGEGGTTLSRDYGLSLGSLPTPTREGYTFAGWWTAASGGTQITSSTIVTGNVIYYAHWQKLCEKVQLWEGGPYWATTNIGAENPEDCGYYFWWGDTVGYKRENDKWVASDGSNSDFSFESDNTPTYGKSISTLQSEGWITSDAVLAPSHDAATVHWGNGWRMPTKDEFDALRNNCDWTWTKQNGVNGYVVKGRGAYASKSIFLPAAGYGNGTSLYRSGSNGYYWSSVPSSDSYYAWDLYFDSSYHITSYSDRYDRQSVRPVLGFTK